MFLSIIEIIASWGLWFWRCQMSACVSATKFALRICGNRISIGLWLLHKLLSIFKSCSGSGLLHMGVCVCVCVWPLCQCTAVACAADWSQNHDKTSLSHCHTRTHTHSQTRTLPDKAVSQTRSAATKCKRDTRRLLRLAAATCCLLQRLDGLQHASICWELREGLCSVAGGVGDWQRVANPIGNLRICSVLPKKHCLC